MKKILILTTGSYVFGTEKVILQILKGLKTEFEFHCLVNGWNDGRFIDQLKELGISYTEHKLGWYYLSNVFWSIDSLIHFPKAIYQFFKIRSRFDLFYTSTFRNIVMLFPFINKKVVYHVHEFNSHSRINRFLIKLIDRKIEKYIAVSKCIEEDLIKIGIIPTKIVVVYNGVKCETVSENFNTKDSKVRIGIVGQISKSKGHLILFNVFHKLYSKNRNLTLKIFGQGASEFINELKANAINGNYNEAVEWIDYEKDIRKIYTQLDILCIPSLQYESFGLVACEAGLFCIPVLASNIGGLREIIVDRQTGFLIDSDDFLELRLIELIESYDLRISMGRSARKHVCKMFDEAIFIGEWKNQIHRII